MTNHIDDSKENLFLNSVTHLLGRNEKLMQTMMGDAAQIDLFFNNSLDEDIHKDKRTAAYFETVKALVKAAYLQADVKAEANKKKANTMALQTIYTILRTVNFLKRRDQE